MPASPGPTALLAALLVLSAIGVVHAPGVLHAQPADAPRTAKKAAPVVRAPVPISGKGEAGLPAPVVDMRQAILEAVRSGRIEDLRTAIELNEIRPVIADGGAGDPLATLRSLSADGSGADVLAALGRVLEAGWVAVPVGADIENNRVYVWPHFAETGVRILEPEAAAELALVVPPEDLGPMLATGIYGYWRIGIGADGTWHFLRR